MTVKDAVVAEIDIAAPPERVFEALTNATQLFEWWGKEPSVVLSAFDMDGRLGGRWHFECSPAAGADQGAVGEQMRRSGAQAYEAHGEVLEMDTPRLLVWSWIANWHEHPASRTVVRWELTPTNNGTHVRVVHSGLSEEHVARKDYGSGWQGVLTLLKNFLGVRSLTLELVSKPGRQP